MVTLWIALVREGKAGTANIAYSAQYLGVIAGAVLAVTFWWIHHNAWIHRFSRRLASTNDRWIQA